MSGMTIEMRAEPLPDASIKMWKRGRTHLLRVGYAVALLALLQSRAMAAITCGYWTEASALVCFHGRMLSALDAKTGRVRWTSALPATIDASPIVLDGTLVWAGNETRQVYGFDLQNRKQLWRTPGRSTMLAPGPNGSVVANDEEFGTIRALRVHDGSELWRHRTRSDQYIEFIVTAADKVFTDQSVVDASDGHELRAQGRPIIALASSDGMVVSVDALGALKMTDARDFTTLWSRNVIGQAKAKAASLTLSSRAIAVLRYEGYPFTSDSGELLVVDPSTGAVRWRRGVGGVGRKLTADMLHMDESYVYLNIRSASGSILQALDHASGAAVWSVENSPGFWGRPLSVADLVYIVSRTDTVYCFNRRDGSQVWSTPMKGKGTLGASYRSAPFQARR